MNDTALQLATDGFCLLRGVLGADTVVRLRQDLARMPRSGSVAGHGGRTWPNAAVRYSHLSWVFSHPPLIAALREVIGPAQLVFTGHCDVHINRLSMWHKDVGGYGDTSYFDCNPFLAPDCRVFKVALYVSAVAGRDGLTLRRGSHLTPSHSAGEPVLVIPDPGDAVLFDVRATHHGQTANALEKWLVGVPKRLLTRQLGAEAGALARRAYLRALRRPDRFSVFFTFGEEGPSTEAFARNNMARQIEELGGSQTELPAALCLGLERLGVKLARVLTPSAAPHSG